MTREDKIRKVIKEFFENDPILLGVMNMVNKDYCTDVKTVGLDYRNYSVPTLKINPDFIDSLDEKQTEIVFASELLKVLLKHPGRSHKHAIQKQLSVLASQLTVNTTKKMKSALEQYAKDVKYHTPEEFKYPEEKSFEYYGKKLEDDMPDPEEMQAQMSGGEGQSSGENGDSSNQQNNSNENSEENKNQNGNENGKSDSTEKMNDYFDITDDSYSDGWGEDELFDSEVSDFIDKNKDNVKSWGKYSGNFMDEIIAANKPAEINYKKVLRQFKAKIIKCNKIISRKKINRRYGIKFPGYKLDRQPKLLFATDISGSMSNEDISEAIATMNKLFTMADIDYCTFDTKVKDTGKLKKKNNKIKITGRGGTDFNDVFEYSNKENYDGVVVFTDGYAPSPSVKPKARTVFLVNNNDINDFGVGTAVNFKRGSENG